MTENFADFMKSPRMQALKNKKERGQPLSFLYISYE
jgi:hypothetical protein